MKKSTKKVLANIMSLVVLLILVAPVITFAFTTGSNPAPPQDIVFDNPFKSNTIEGFLDTIINEIFMPIGGVVAVLMIMYAGFLFVTARGEPAKLTKAKDALLYAAIGAAILLGAWVISSAIGSTINDLKRP